MKKELLLNSDMLEEINHIVLLNNENIQEQIATIHTNFMGILNNALESLKIKYPKKFSIEYFGDYFFNTFNQNISPLTYFILVKEDKAVAKSSLYFLQKSSGKIKNEIIDKSLNCSEYNIFEIANSISDYLDENLHDEIKIFTKHGTIRAVYRDINIKIAFGYQYCDGDCDFYDNGILKTLNISKAKNNIQSFIKKTNYNFSDLSRLLKTFELELLLANKTNRYFSYITMFVETLLYNVPYQLFLSENIFDCYVKIMNYLKITDFDNFIYVDDSLICDELYKKNLKTFYKKMEYFMLNAKDIIEKEIKNSTAPTIDESTIKGKIKKKVQDFLDD